MSFFVNPGYTENSATDKNTPLFGGKANRPPARRRMIRCFFGQFVVITTCPARRYPMDTEQKESMKQILTESAIRVVARDGLDKTTTKLIAADAKLNEAYIYRCFKNKEALLAEAFYTEDVRFAHHIRTTLPIMKTPGIPWEDKCFLLWKSCWNFIIEKPDDCRFYLRYYYSANCREYAYSRHLGFYKPLIEKVRFAFRPETNLDILVHQIFDTMLSFAARVQSGEITNDEVNVEWMFRQIFGFVSINAVPELLEKEIGGAKNE